jgi:hypothetical protein
MTIVAAVLVVAGTSCTDGISEYDEAVTAAVSCTADETCVIAGGVWGCRCPVAVVADQEADVNQAAAEAECPDEYERLACVPVVNPRCDNGRCLADTQQE